VATDHDAIYNHVTAFGGNVLMTAAFHNSGTERCCEVADKLQLAGEDYDVVINIQGDEPYINPEQISQVALCFDNPQIQLATLIKKIGSQEELTSPNVVKVVIDYRSNALLFSRSVIPFFRGKEVKDWLEATPYFKHIGIYGYQAAVLKAIVSLPASASELAESLEQLRWLDHGYKIKTQMTEYESIAIDSPADLLKITNRNGTIHQ
jgi:3-deoxy-manno-octulosonate cytidylyltransferase (CMP-KDO synthetase)